MCHSCVIPATGSRSRENGYPGSLWANESSITIQNTHRMVPVPHLVRLYARFKEKNYQATCDTLILPCVSVGISCGWVRCEGIYLVKRAIFGSRWLRWEHTASPTWAEREVVNRGPTGVRSKCLSSDTRITSRKKCHVAFLVSSTSCVIIFGFGIDLFWTRASNNTPMLTVSCCIV